MTRSSTCDRALLLERGELVTIGESAAVARRYTQVNFAISESVIEESSTTAQDSDDGEDVQLVDVWTQDAGGQRGGEVSQGRPCALFMRVRFGRRVSDPVFTLTLSDEKGRDVFAVTSEVDRGATGDFEAGQYAVVGTSFDNWLAPARYDLSAQVGYPGPGGHAMARAENAATLLVTGERGAGGVVDFPHAFFINHVTRSAKLTVQRAAG
ncbi:MAG: Wzt carbohydrate-binding domain-containing protein [Actinobacteria bacterium]|nr:Wzt carbohydrate-binding domain-containing protein [Actinomycetota bacterium]